MNFNLRLIDDSEIIHSFSDPFARFVVDGWADGGNIKAVPVLGL